MATVIVIGGGAAGCEAAFQLARRGTRVHVVEKSSETGGNLNNWYQLFPDRKDAGKVRAYLRERVSEAGITLHAGMEPARVERTTKGGFAAELTDGSVVEADAVLVATGFRTFDEYV